MYIIQNKNYTTHINLMTYKYIYTLTLWVIVPVEFNCIKLLNILIMYPWVLLTVAELPTFEILLSQIEFLKTNYETQLQNSKSNICRHFVVVI